MHTAHAMSGRVRPAIVLAALLLLLAACSRGDGGQAADDGTTPIQQETQEITAPDGDAAAADVEPSDGADVEPPEGGGFDAADVELPEQAQETLDGYMVRLERSEDFCDSLTVINGLLQSIDREQDPQVLVAALNTFEQALHELTGQAPDEIADTIAADAERRIARLAIVADVLQETGQIESVSDPEVQAQLQEAYSDEDAGAANEQIAQWQEANC